MPRRWAPRLSSTLVSTMSSNPELKVSDQDLKFLKSLRIKIDEEKHDKEK